MSTRREKELPGIAKVLHNFWGRERDIAAIKEMVVRDPPITIFVVGAKFVGKSELARQLYQRWLNNEEKIVPVLFRFIGDLVLCDKRTLLEQLSEKVISGCQAKDRRIGRAQEKDSRSLLDQAEEAVRTMHQKKRNVVILVDDWLGILDRCQELDPRAFGDFLNIAVTRLRKVGAAFVFLDRFSCNVLSDVLPQSIRVKLPVRSREYYLRPLTFNELATCAEKVKENLSPDDEVLWDYVGGDIDLVKGLCQHWKSADAMLDYERKMIHDVMGARIDSLVELGATKEQAIKLLLSYAESPETVVDNPAVKELCKMGVLVASGGGPWICGAMREYLLRNGGEAREHNKLKVVLKCRTMFVEIGGKRPIPFQEDKKGALKFALLYLLLTDKDRYGHMTYSTYSREILGHSKDRYTTFMEKFKSKAKCDEGWGRKISKVSDYLEIVTRDDVKEAADALREKDFEPLLEIKKCHVIPICRSSTHPIPDDSNWPDFLEVAVEDQ